MVINVKARPVQPTKLWPSQVMKFETYDFQIGVTVGDVQYSRNLTMQSS